MPIDPFLNIIHWPIYCLNYVLYEKQIKYGEYNSWTPQDDLIRLFEEKCTQPVEVL